MRNATFTLTQSEYIYFTLWSLVVTTDVATVSEQAQQLKSATSIVKVRCPPFLVAALWMQWDGIGLWYITASAFWSGALGSSAMQPSCPSASAKHGRTIVI